MTRADAYIPSDKLELVLIAARTLLAHRDVGRTCDPASVRWAEKLIERNPARAWLSAERATNEDAES